MDYLLPPMSAPHRHFPRGLIYGVLSAVLFGVSAPLSKKLTPEAGAFSLAALLYLGSGVALTVLRALQRPGRVEAKLSAKDLPKLAVMTVCGGVAAPVLLLYGLARVSGVAGSLLLNLEQVFTIVIAVTFFKDHLGRMDGVAVALLLVGAGILGWAPGGLAADTTGMLAIAGACLAWAVDNNVTERLSLKDPLALTQVKSLSGGFVNAAIALALSQRWPSWQLTGASLGLGALSYGASLVLFILAIREIGAARQSALFAAAPFAGALASIPVLGESLSLRQGVAGLVIAGGVALLSFARHGHRHAHDRLFHEHVHTHDSHHQHSHGPQDGPIGAEPHSHPHEHEPLEHDHPHLPDAHHRHRHS
jgi:drug/metabolite transporter (DMT)-like permease